MTSQTQWKARPAARPRPESFGVFYPKGGVVAVIDDERDAETAVKGLTAAGVPKDAIDELQSADVVRLDDALRRRRSGLGAIGALLSSLLGDDGRYQQEYVGEARKGHRTLVIHGRSSALVAAMHPALAAGHAHHARFYRSMVVEDLV
jgi:hypothetical protein